MLPIFQTPDATLMLMQTRWASQINPLLNQPVVNGNYLKNITLAVGNNVINHKLARKAEGYIITDQTAASQIYRSQPFTDTSITLNASAACTVNLLVF